MPLLGREDVLAEVLAALTDEGARDGVARLVTLVGPAGVGKTRLAAEVADRAGRELGVPVAWVSLGGVSNPAFATAAIGSALDVGEGDPQAAVEAIARAIDEPASRPASRAPSGDASSALLVLDALVELVPNLAFLDELRAAAPGVAILATSRRPLRLDGEVAIRIGPLAIPDRGAAPDVIADQASVRLLVASASGTRVRLEATPANAGLLADLVRRLDGLPLALELAGAALQRLDPAQLLARLAATLDPSRAALPVSERLSAQAGSGVLAALAIALDRSVELLSPAGQVVYRRLGALAGPFDAPLAAAVVERGVLLGLPDPGGEVAAAVDELVDASLLRRDGGRAPLVMLETVRADARARLDRAGELETAEWAHAHVVTEAVEGVDARLVPVLDERALGELDALAPEAMTAFDRAASRGGDEVVLRLAAALAEWLRARGRLIDGRLRVELALRRTEGRRDPLRARAAFGGALLAYRHGDFGRARGLLEEAIALFEAAGDPTRLARAWNTLALVSFAEARMADAAEAAERGLAIRRAVGDDPETAASLNTLGGIRHFRGELDAARAALEAGLEIRERLADESGLAVCLANLALVDRDLGELDRAAARLEAAIATRRRLGDRLREATTVHNLGLVRLEQGRREEARQAIEAALALARAHDDRVEIGEALADLSLIARDGGRIGDAWQLATEAVRVASRIGARGVLALALEATAALAGGEDPADGARIWAAASGLRTRTGYSLLRADRRRLEAEIEEARARCEPGVWERAWGEGSGLDEHEAARLALERSVLTAPA